MFFSVINYCDKFKWTNDTAGISFLLFIYKIEIRERIKPFRTKQRKEKRRERRQENKISNVEILYQLNKWKIECKMRLI